jgi:quercetin dioxygenase-like cupin family protein
MKTLHVAKPIHRPPLRRALLLIAPALVITAVLAAVPAHATPQSGVTSVAIANGTFDDIDVYAKTDIDPGPTTDYWKAAISTKGASHLYLVQNTVIPGGTFGWHSHPGPSLVIVKSGTATEYEGDDPTCTPHLHPAGSTFVDAGEASGHLVRNESLTDNLVVIVVRLIPEALVPTQRIDLPNPGYCPNIN